MHCCCCSSVRTHIAGQSRTLGMFTEATYRYKPIDFNAIISPRPPPPLDADRGPEEKKHRIGFSSEPTNQKAKAFRQAPPPP
ncbi:hypothetical protein F2P81_006867 [Scophthalmus maximus]|uniref:Uncharacterized protein n=1 Tax=Scophthalmus maximus TaxID=52904 RepID=A0A6A4T7Y9_SCOMX|nr:hypothetical protein F2P81_006867 [Scophthalmus maximus]